MLMTASYHAGVTPLRDRVPRTMADLITESGRENLNPDDRVALLAADAEQLRGNKLVPPDDTKARRAFYEANGATIHALTGLIGWIMNLQALWAKNLRAKITSEMLSQIECCVLAWRRGGYVEHHRVVKAQYVIQRACAVAAS